MSGAGGGGNGFGGFDIHLEGPLWDGRGGARLAALMRVALVAGATRIETAAARGTPVNTGLLRQSIGRQIVEDGVLGGAATGGTYPAKITAYVGSPITYGPHVEYGTRPHWPPHAPIEAWVRRKLRDAVARMAAETGAKARARSLAATLETGDGRTRTKRQRRKLEGAIATERAVKTLTFLIRRKIALKGTRGASMLRDAVKAEHPWVVRAVTAGVDRWASEA